MEFDKDYIKNSLTIEQVEEYIAQLGGEPIRQGDSLICKTICHNHDDILNASHKLYYYDNTKLFHCWTECGDSFDIFDLVKRVTQKSLPKSIEDVAIYFGFSPKMENFEDPGELLPEWDFFKNRAKIDSLKIEKNISLPTYSEDILKWLPQPHIKPWEKEGITYSTIVKNNIHFDPLNQGIIIPHYNINGELIGIRTRTIVKEEEEYGKYRPAILNGKMYNHPLSFNLYNLNNSKENIKSAEIAIVGEGEKFSLMYQSLFDYDISVACCGSSLISHQVNLLLSLGVKEIVIAFDRQFKEKGDKEFKGWTKKLTDINKKYSNIVKVSFMFDKWNLLEYKDSPIDKGRDIFLELFKKRITL